MARKKQLEDEVSLADLLDTLDDIAHPDINSPDYGQCLIHYPDFDPYEDHGNVEAWMRFEGLSAQQQSRIKKEIRKYSRATGKDFMMVSPEYCKDKGCTGHFVKAKSHLNGFSGDINNCYAYIASSSRK